MSVEKNKKEAKRWLITARDDLDTAKLLQTNKKFAHSCFHAQQAAEKAVKAIWYFIEENPWGHSIKRLIEDLQHVEPVMYEHLSPLLNDGMVLDRFYIPTRYPNGIPDITPAAAYMDEDARTCIDKAEKILEEVERIIELS